MSAGAEAVDPGVVLFSGFADEPHDGYQQLLAECPVSRSSGGMGGTETGHETVTRERQRGIEPVSLEQRGRYPIAIGRLM